MLTQFAAQSQSSAAGNTKLRRSAKAILAGVILLAILIRIPGLFTDFWLDEIWSWFIAYHLHWPGDILLSGIAHVDNNHPLNTLWLYMVGAQQPAWLYRLPPLMFGCGSVVLAAHIMWRRGPHESIFTATLVAFSFPQVFYSSEARGYAAVVFFAFLSLDAIELWYGNLAKSPAPPPRTGRILQGVVQFACVMGFLSHLTFLHVYIALLTTSFVVVFRQVSDKRERWLLMTRLHAVPILAAVILYVTFIAGMEIGGAPPVRPSRVILKSISLTVGGTDAGAVAIVAAIVGTLVFAGAVVDLGRRCESLAIFSLVAVIGSPLLVCGEELWLSSHPQPLMTRYFLVCLAIALLPAGCLFGRLWRNSRGGKIGVAVALVLFFAGNMRNMSLFLEAGRGHYGDALAQIRAQDSDRVIRIASENPARSRMILEYWMPRVFPGRILDINAQQGRWLLLSDEPDSPPPQIVHEGVNFHLVRAYPGGLLSGLPWQLYRRN